MAKKHKTTDEPDVPVRDDATEAHEQDVLSAVAPDEAGGEPVSPEDELQQALEAAQQKADQNWDMYLRERAELENYRKRSQREKEDAIRFANDRLLKEMLPVIDNLERAVEHAEQNEEESQGLLEGVNMTLAQFNKVLENFGIKPIPALGQVFDPNLHQAMGQMETDDYPANTVAAEYQKGYLLHDRLLRPSMVMVAKAPAADAETPESEERNDNAS